MLKHVRLEEKVHEKARQLSAIKPFKSIQSIVNDVLKKAFGLEENDIKGDD